MEVGLGPVRPGSPCSSSFFTLGEPPAAGSRPSPPLPAGPVAAEGLPPPSAVMALDPAEQHLRHVEKDVLIPKIMREKAKERCSGQVEDASGQLFDRPQLGAMEPVVKRRFQNRQKDSLKRFYEMLQGYWNSYGSQMSKRKLCIERMSHYLL
ncbi:COX assembly mitochondrial protein homolog isoform X2 [Perognathus longimembris pacificus]|uniref:COX assembly mitochondrial protein homolog isoform X2 n=1 Tax=Perognathus longimembris pacificus TaxID=214514 RepID=UPI00201A13F2|nr:COX assembly mitochondrial protein homolog isoform X2 [Perognathus longimembris pacificus]